MLQQADRPYSQTFYGGSTGTYSGDYEETALVVRCEEVMPLDWYIIEKYTDSSKTFFENMNCAQQGLGEMAIYPKNYQDSSRLNENYPYPYFLAPAYPENSLLEGYGMYEFTQERSLLFYSYPAVLNSTGFPSVMSSIARKLEPECIIERNDFMHWMIDITFEGETEMYGGAGAGGTNHIYTKYIGLLYTFNGDENDYMTKNIEEKRQKILEINDQSLAELEEYKKYLSKETIVNFVGNGSWLRIAGDYAYAYTVNINGVKQLYYGSEIWVDGRYVSAYEVVEPGATFEEYPEATIVLRNMTYTNEDGEVVTQDVEFIYNYTYDAWYAYKAYFETSQLSQVKWEKMPDDMILTREEVEAMDVDRNTNKLPESGLIYDGTVEPGTPFVNK